MNSKTCSLIFLSYLIGSTLCVIPEGEYQIGPVFGPGSRFFGGNKYFEAFLDKGQIKPLLAKKVLLGVGAVGVGALAAGGAALLAKKHQGLGGFGGHGHYATHGSSGGWYPSTSYDYSQSQSQGNSFGSVNFPATNNYQYEGYQSTGGDYNSGYVDQSAYNYGQGNYGWSR